MFWKKLFAEDQTAAPGASGAGGTSGTGGAGGDTETVRRIVSKLEAMEPAEARYVAGFAYILGRVAHADQHISAEETAAMEEAVARFGGLEEDQAVLVVQIAKSQNRLTGGTENFLVTREFAKISSSEQKDHLLDCLFAISAADESISTTEETQVRQIASELGFSHRDYVLARSKYSEHREVMKGFRSKGSKGSKGSEGNQEPQDEDD